MMGENVRAFRLWLIRHHGIVGKDLIQYNLPLFTIGFSVMMVVVGFGLIGVLFFGNPAGQLVPIDLTRFLILAGFYVAGLSLFGEEEEQNTRALLMRLPLTPSRIYTAKLCSAAVLMPAYLALVIAVSWLSGPQSLGPFLGAVMSFPSPDLLVATALACFGTGCLMGVWFGRNFATAMLMGAAVLVAFLGTVFRYRFATSTTQISLIVGGVGLLAMIDALRGLRSKTEAPARLEFIDSESRFPVWLKGIRRSIGIDLRMPETGAIRLSLVLAVVAGLVGFFRATIGAQGELLKGLSMVVTPVVGFLGAIVGVAMLDSGERQGARFFVYTLPVNPWRWISARTLWLAAAGGAVGLGWMIGCYAWLAVNPASDGSIIENSLPLAPAVGILAALLGHYGAWISSSRLVSFISAATMTLLLGLFGETALTQADLLTAGQRFAELAWASAVLIAAPTLLLMVAVAGSPLPVAKESMRSLLGVLAAVIVGAWMLVLLGINPPDLAVVLNL